MAQAPDPRVLAILVAHDGASWLPRTLDALDAQSYPHLRVVAVDNGSRDGSRDLLIERFGPDDLLVAERDLGFGGAVAMALDATLEDPAEWVLLVHDDVALEPDAVERLVCHAASDPRLAVVGPKLRRWEDPTRLAEVGMTVDLTGRADAGIEPDELDQGQRDLVRRSLYVSTAGMMVRRDVYRDLGGFDRRYHLFRDDLDLCWRVWLAGYEVEVVPEAVGVHAAGASNYRRLGQTAFLGPRYFAERNTLATLLKCYSATRLIALVPLFMVVGLAKVVGFVFTRRVSDAWQTVRAWAWNLLHLRGTLRRRRAVQARRDRADRELAPLFARTAPRGRAYAEAVGEWVAGGEIDVEQPPAETVAEPPPAGRRILRFVADHPIVVGGGVLVVAGLVASLPLLDAGNLRGGDFAPWPEDADFLATYRSGWNGAGGLGSAAPPSPAQALLGILGFLTAGSAWLAQRVLLLAPLPIAWLLALRAGRVLTPARAPRLAAATVYVLSPPALAALLTGRLGGLVVTACLPALVVVGEPLLRPDAEPSRAWRAAAAAAIVAAIGIAFEPPFALVVLGLSVLGLAVALVLSGTAEQRRTSLIRLAAAVFGAFLLLFPWSVSLLRTGSPVVGGLSDPLAASAPFWRWLLLGPELPGFPGIVPGIGFLAAGTLGLALGSRQRPGSVASLWGVALTGVVVAWATGRAGQDAWAWPGLPLLVTAAAFAALLAVAFASAEAQLGQHTFGWRQVATLATGVLVLAGIVTSGWRLFDDPWDAYAVGEPALPSFLAPEQEQLGPFRILVVSNDDGVLHWDLTGPSGPSMVRFGAPVPRGLVEFVGGAVRDMVAGSDPGAAGRLGLANVRYVVVPQGGRGTELEQAFADQLDLEPQPVASGLVYRVADWLPRVSWVPLGIADSMERRGELPPGADPVAFEAVPDEQATYVGEVPGPGTILVAEIGSTGWEAHTDGASLGRIDGAGFARFRTTTAHEEVVVEYARDGRRLALVLIELTVFLLAVSLLLRPPRFAREEPRP